MGVRETGERDSDCLFQNAFHINYITSIETTTTMFANNNNTNVYAMFILMYTYMHTYICIRT